MGGETLFITTSIKLIRLNHLCYNISLTPPLAPNRLLGSFANKPDIRSLISELRNVGNVTYSLRIESYIFYVFLL